MAKLQIFTCWLLFTPIVGAVHGEDAVRSCLWSSDGPPFHHLRHGGLERYDSLWLARVPHAPTCWDVGSSRLQAALDLPLRKSRLRRRPARHTPPREEALVPVPTGGGAPSVGPGPLDDLNVKTPALRLEPMLGSNPTVSAVHIVLYSLFNPPYMARRLRSRW